MIIEHAEQIRELSFDADGLLPMITQDARTGEVLMLAWCNAAAIEATLRDRSMWYWSRSRRSLWHKGDTSGNVQALVSLHADCDRDSMLALVEPAGPACHTGELTCFGAAPVLPELGHTIERRVREPAAGYTDRLLGDPNLRHKKLGEEAVELVSACLAADPPQVAAEAADLLYHVLVACAASGVGVPEVLGELLRRRTPLPPPGS